jgi:hypothetical protein
MRYDEPKIAVRKCIRVMIYLLEPDEISKILAMIDEQGMPSLFY